MIVMNNSKIAALSCELDTLGREIRSGETDSQEAIFALINLSNEYQVHFEDFIQKMNIVKLADLVGSLNNAIEVISKFDYYRRYIKVYRKVMSKLDNMNDTFVINKGSAVRSLQINDVLQLLHNIKNYLSYV